MEVVYDVETFPNVFTACFAPIHEEGGYLFEISDRRNDSVRLRRYLETLTVMIGFNNVGFDWPVIQFILDNPDCTAEQIYEFAMCIISSDDRFGFVIWNPIIEQIDLYKIWHFDNRAKSTSLKKLQFNMRSQSVQDLPFPVGTYLNSSEIDILLKYNAHDVTETKAFYFKSLDKILLRREIEPFWMNCSDTRLGRNYFIRELENAGIACFTRPEDGGRRQPITTTYPDGVLVGDIIFPYLHFHTPELQAVLEKFKKIRVKDYIDADERLDRVSIDPDGQLVNDPKDDAVNMELYGHPVWYMADFTNYKFMLDDVEITMGLGGVHGSIEYKLVENCIILDLDVTSFYPSISIKNRLYPKHLGEGFCDVYQNLLDQRLVYAKGTARNGAIKMSLVSVFGSAGSHFTCFYDLAYMLGTTINGQFLILSLTELLLRIEGVRLIQVNTDGVTIIIPDGKMDEVNELYMAWQSATQLPLEANRYKRLWMRDVNNYIAEYEDGHRKRKGAYQPDRDWHQNQSMPVVRMAAEAAMCDGVPIEGFLSQHSNPWDFLMRLDLTRTSRLELDDGREMHGVIRYYVSPTGNAATKVMPKTRTRIHAGGHAEAVGTRGEWTCTVCGKVFKRKSDWVTHAGKEHSSKITVVQEYNGEPLDFDMRFYKEETRKLIIQ